MTLKELQKEIELQLLFCRVVHCNENHADHCEACDDIIDNYVNDKIATFEGNVDAEADKLFNKAYNNVYLKEVAKTRKYKTLKGIN